MDITPEEFRESFLRLASRKDVATLLGVDENTLITLFYILPLHERYTRFEIPKKSGGKRQIHAPTFLIRNVQLKLKEILDAVYLPKPSAHGFVATKSIVTNASCHVQTRYILNIDLEDFFPSIHFGRVRGLFMGNPYFLDTDVATFLADICCHNGVLPQGASTSPVISNMICVRLDSKMQQLAKKYHCMYTRYADDITFSTKRSKFPSALATISRLGQVEVGVELRNTIEENGFTINNRKVRLQLLQQRQEVTGLTVNEFPNVQRKYVKQLRGILHAWEKYGLESTAGRYFARYASPQYTNPECYRPPFERIVLGKIEFVGMVKGKESPVYLSLLRKFEELAPEFV